MIMNFYCIMAQEIRSDRVHLLKASSRIGFLFVMTMMANLPRVMVRDDLLSLG